ncbi:MAG TPA: VCBS repeat-containing protein, partial [Crocinitomix sp.]|nr:VCBS repeat-containing protein [Crocinitomix sp.]
MVKNYVSRYNTRKKEKNLITTKTAVLQRLLFLFVFVSLGLFNVNSFAQEICNNGIDDDGDGFVDGFDPDCASNLYFYGGLPNDACSVPSQDTAITMREKWSSEAVFGNFPGVVAGDIDNDGVIEGLSQGNNGEVIIINLSDGSIERTFNTAATVGIETFEVGTFAIADVDGDGFSEIFITVDATRRLYSYSHLGVLNWTSDVELPALYLGSGAGGYNSLGSPALADFNADGVPEVYVGASIFNAQTGVQLMRGADGIGNNPGFWNPENSISVAADLIPTVAGLELAAGNTIYEVGIINTNGMAGNIMTAHVTPGVPDGFTSIADVNKDGNLDVIVTNGVEGIFVINPLTNSVIASVPLGYPNNMSGHSFVGDVDNDCQVEIGVCVYSKLLMFEYDGTSNLALKWETNTTDASGATGLTMFDFNQDGNSELIYRDTNKIRIINGNTGIDIVTMPSFSDTGVEYPIVLDIDNDGASEIIIVSYDSSSIDGDPTRMYAFESNSIPWAPSRAVWNQKAYTSTNINDDLTVPRQQQNTAQFFACADCDQPYNSFLEQSTFRTQSGCTANPVADLSISIQSVNIANGEVTYSVTNSGDKVFLSGGSVTFYDANPTTTNATVIATILTTADVNINSIVNGLTGNLGVITSSSVFAVVNDNATVVTQFDLAVDFPSTFVEECDYTNNITEYVITLPDIDGDNIPDDVDLDNDNDGILDTDECSGNVTLINSLITGLNKSVGQLDDTWKVEWVANDTGDILFAPVGIAGQQDALVTGSLAGTWVNPAAYSADWISLDFSSLNANCGVGNHTDADNDGVLHEAYANEQVGATGDHVALKYSNTFSVPIGAFNVSLDLDFASDNNLYKVFINNIEQNLNTTGGFTVINTLTLNEGIITGLNTIDVYLNSGPDQIGFMVTEARLDFCGDTDGDNIPDYLDTDSDNDG